MVLEKLKSILGIGEGEEKEKVEEREPVKLQKISLEELRGKIEKKKNNPIQESDAEIVSLIERISDIETKIKNLSSELANAEPEEEVHPNVYKSAKEARRLLLQKMDRAIEKIEVPTEREWNKLLDFNRSLQDAVNLLKNARLNHGGQASTVFGEKVSKFDRLTEKIQPLSKELNTSLRKIKLNLDELDELLEDINRRENIIERIKKTEDALEELRNQKKEIEKEYNRVKDSLESLKRSDRFEELENMKEEIEGLSQQKDEIKADMEATVSQLKRPLRKMDKMIERDDHMVSKDVLEALESYLEEPAQTALREEEGLPKFRSMVEELEDVLEEKMELEDRERKKRLNEVRKILENEKLVSLQNRFFETEDKQKELKKEIDSSSLLEKKERLEKSLEKEESKLNKVKDRIDKSEDKLRDLKEQIKSTSERIEEKAKSLFDIRVEI